uniref:Uncharacterized protein n=1 Tax=Meloidogyne enterolobii TaxID=390850 RepID=A0A6V7VK62_MELEN|nr:unnamed protein product [Meloidogyne enterolobii]
MEDLHLHQIMNCLQMLISSKIYYNTFKLISQLSFPHYSLRKINFQLLNLLKVLNSKGDP